MTRPYRTIAKTDELVCRTTDGLYAVRQHTDRAHARQGLSYWLIVHGWGDAGGWSWHPDDQFAPATGVTLWRGRDGGSGIEVILPDGAEPRQEWLSWSPVGWDGEGPWPLPADVPDYARQIVR